MIKALLAALSLASRFACASEPPVSLSVIIPADLGAAFPSAAAEAAAVPSVPGVPIDLSWAIATIAPATQVKDPPPARRSQVVKVDLPSLLNRNLRTGEGYASGRDKFFLGTQVSLSGEVYMSVQGHDWGEPYFFTVEKDMSPRWRSTSGAVYNATLDVSIFRKKFNNLLVIKDEATGAEVLRRKLSDFFHSAYKTGDTVAIGGNSYKAFYSFVLGTKRDPVTFDRSAYGICLLYDESDDPGYHDIQVYPFPLAALKGPKPAAYRLHDGQILYFSLEDEGKTLAVTD